MQMGHQSYSTAESVLRKQENKLSLITLGSGAWQAVLQVAYKMGSPKTATCALKLKMVRNNTRIAQQTSVSINALWVQ
jgi:hypothetical protein